MLYGEERGWSCSSPTANQEADLSLIRQIRSGNRRAQETLIEKYVPMVKYIVRKHYRGFLEFDDLVQEGLIGLFSAICEYRPECFDVKFSSFAYLCIQRKVFNAIKQASGNKHRLLNHAVSLHSYVNAEETRTVLDYLADDDAANDPTFVAKDRLMTEQLKVSLSETLSLLELRVAFLLLDGYSVQDMDANSDSLLNKLTMPVPELKRNCFIVLSVTDRSTHPKLAVTKQRNRLKKTCLPTGS